MPGTEGTIRISVRTLVEFLFRGGDIDNRMGSGKSLEAMAEGSRLHRKIQGRMGGGYEAEVLLRESFPFQPEGDLLLELEGRADGIFTLHREEYLKQKAGVTFCDGLPVFGAGKEHEEEAEEEMPSGIRLSECLPAGWEAEPSSFTVIDEIKTMYREVGSLDAPVPVHLAQALCYAWIRMKQEDLGEIGVQMTYCQIETEEIRRFRMLVKREELEGWFSRLLSEYEKWARWQIKERELRISSTQSLEFPFSYRPGQRDLVVAVYRSIHRKKHLFVQAPTGVGKTMSVVFPAVRAMGEGIGEKLFYATAKNVTRQVGAESLRILRDHGLHFSSVTITAKEKICPLGKAECRPDLCPRARGHFDRVNDALYELLNRYQEIGKRELEETAERHEVCPFELSLDACSFTDGILCDYNYLFDPNVNLKRFFAEGAAGRYLFLVDEAHNLVDRAREMYSAVLVKEQFLKVKKLMKLLDRKMEQKLERCNRVLLSYKRECDKVLLLPDVNDLYLALTALMGEMEEFRDRAAGTDPGEDYRELFFAVRHFLNMYEERGEGCRIYGEFNREGEFLLRLFCVHPAEHLKAFLKKSVQTVFFSATLLPVDYYKELLGGEKEDYAIYVPSPFPGENRALILCQDVSSRYSRRSPQQYERIAREVSLMVRAKEGHYLAFFPSYAFLREVEGELLRLLPEDCQILVQKENMKEEEKEKFLQSFRMPEEGITRLGLCVLGGAFSEGIDLKGDHLIGTAVVGVGLPQVCTEREILRSFFEEKGKSGFDYAYRFPGMNKVLQAAGRVIRTMEDQGVILLLDDRFLSSENQALFPREWQSFYRADLKSLSGILKEFWEMRQMS